MASFEGENGQENDKEESDSALTPVKRETENILRQFVYERFEEDDAAEEGEVPVTETARPDALEELRSIRQENDPDSTAVRISRKLREVADEMNSKYRDEFHDMISQLNLTSTTAYSSFAEVARRLFRRGITWNRIVALLCFGYEIAKHVLRYGLGGMYMRRIYQLVIDFIVHERIAAWINQNGGWRAFLADFRLSEPSWPTIATVFVVGILCVAWSLRSNK